MRLLGCHVGRRAEGLRALVRRVFPHLAYEAEIEHDHAALLGHEYVRGLDVPVQTPRLVQGVQGVHELGERRTKAREIRLAATSTHEVHKREAVHELHRQVPAASLVKQLVQRDQVRVKHAR
jgi:hypothetical protein